MTAESWNEEIYERQLQIYLNLKGQYTQMEKDIKGLQAQLLTYMDSRDIQAAQLDDKQVRLDNRYKEIKETGIKIQDLIKVNIWSLF